MRSMCAWISLHRIMIREWAWLVRCVSSWHGERGVEVHSHIFFGGPRKTFSRKELLAPDLGEFRQSIEPQEVTTKIFGIREIAAALSVLSRIAKILAGSLPSALEDRSSMLPF